MVADEPRLDTNRRNLLQRALLVLGGTVGAGLGSRAAPVAAAPVPAIATIEATRIVWHGRFWHSHASELRRGQLPGRGDRVSYYAELLDEPAGDKIGEFYAASFCANAPFGWDETAATSLELHTFSLADGSITGQGVGHAGAGTFAIVGGTGRYAGARGTYTIERSLAESGGDGTAEFRLTLLG